MSQFEQQRDRHFVGKRWLHIYFEQYLQHTQFAVLT